MPGTDKSAVCEKVNSILVFGSIGPGTTSVTISSVSKIK